jgi:hypothetical protein
MWLNRLTSIAACSVLVAASASPAPKGTVGMVGHERSIAGPALIVFDSGALGKRIVLRDRGENMRILTNSAPVVVDQNGGAQRLAKRVYVGVWLFWMPGWSAQDSAAVANLRLSNADQVGRLYLGAGSDFPILFTGSTRFAPAGYKVLDSTATAILERHGVPTRLRRAR